MTHFLHVLGIWINGSSFSLIQTRLPYNGKNHSIVHTPGDVHAIVMLSTYLVILLRRHIRPGLRSKVTAQIKGLRFSSV